MRMDDDELLPDTFELAAELPKTGVAVVDADDALAELLVAADACCGETEEEDEDVISLPLLQASLLSGTLITVAAVA